jgi:preprotein translocase subunit SecD
VRPLVIATVMCLTSDTPAVQGGASQSLGNPPSGQVQIVQLPELELRLADLKAGPGLQKASTPSGETIWIAYTAVVTQSDVVGAFMIETDGRFNIGLEFTSDAAQRVAAATKEHVGKLIAIVINRQITSAPVLQAPISDSVMISGSFTRQDIQDLLGPFQLLAKKNRAERGFLCNWIGWC